MAYSPPSESEIEEFEGFATCAIHTGQSPDKWKSRAIVPPIVTSNVFKTDVYSKEERYLYSRGYNPTRGCLEENIAALEGGKYAVVLGSGLGALATLCFLLKSGDHVVICEGYGGTQRFFRHCASQNGLTFTFVEGTETEKFVEALRPNTRMVWLESPTNPIMKLVDIKDISSRVREATAQWKEKPFIAVDNSVMTPYFQKPLSLGADVVMHSVSKYMNGHSDVTMGALVVNDNELYNKLRFFKNAVGVTSSGFDSYLVLRGLKTLHVRMKEHEKNGLEVARFLEKHPGVARVQHPGLLSHPQYELGKRQMSGYSGLMSMYVNGSLEDAKTFISQLKIFSPAASLGGYESLCEISMDSSQVLTPKEHSENTGITESLIRLSVGIEDVKDLKRDLRQALDHMVAEQAKGITDSDKPTSL